MAPKALSVIFPHFDNFRVNIKFSQEGEEERKGLPVSDEHAINQAFLMDLIIVRSHDQIT